ncbi:unnamed protein product [Prunus armeniaca]
MLKLISSPSSYLQARVHNLSSNLGLRLGPPSSPCMTPSSWLTTRQLCAATPCHDSKFLLATRQLYTATGQIKW